MIPTPPAKEYMEAEDDVRIPGFSSKIRFSNVQPSQSHPKPFCLYSFYLGTNQWFAVKKKRKKALCCKWTSPFRALLCHCSQRWNDGSSRPGIRLGPRQLSKTSQWQNMGKGSIWVDPLGGHSKLSQRLRVLLCPHGSYQEFGLLSGVHETPFLISQFQDFYVFFTFFIRHCKSISPTVSITFRIPNSAAHGGFVSKWGKT